MHSSLSRSAAILAFASTLVVARSAHAQNKAQDDDDDLVVPSTPGSQPGKAPASAPSAAPAAKPAAAAPQSPTAPATAPAAANAAPASAEVLERLAVLEQEAKEARERNGVLGHLAELLAPYRVTGFLQSEYQTNQTSEDQLGQGGTLLNKDRFTLRRARVRVDGEYKYAALQLEADGNTIRGPQMRILHAFGTLKLPGNDPRVPLVAVTMGLFDTPFGYELTEWPRNRWFMERSTASQAFFSAEPDVGIKLHGGISFLRYDVAFMNGEPLENKNGFPGLTPRSEKDIVFRIGAETTPRSDLGISGHVSALRGKGFHAGNDATKGVVQWKDANEDGAIQSTELSGVSAASAVPSQTFDRWAVGADLQLRLRTELGQSTLYGELVLANNLDRTLFIADPVVNGTDSRELGFYAGFTQEITKWGVAGFRYDHYDPNADFFDKRGGKLIPTSQAIDTFSPMVGLVLPDPKGTDRARLLFQYDIVRDKLARDDRGLPHDLKNNVLTLRLQVAL